VDKSVIFAVAGSGKTTTLISKLNLENRFLILTYTDANYENLKSKVMQEFGFLPENIKINKYSSFLYSFCFRPFLSLELGTKGVYVDQPPVSASRLPHANINYFVNSASKRVYLSRLAKFLEVKGILGEVRSRLEKYFDVLLVDEVQDFAGHDFNFLKELAKINLNVLLVGDFFQHTYDTSRDGAVNKNLHNDYLKYQKEFRAAGFNVDLHSLIKSHRCGSEVCKFISDEIGIQIESHAERKVDVHWVTEPEEAVQIYQCKKTVKLFFSDHHKYSCFSQNWGASKGQDHYDNVCVVVNKTTYDLYKKGRLSELASTSRNKFYVACSRARNNLFFVPESLVGRFKKK